MYVVHFFRRFYVSFIIAGICWVTAVPGNWVHAEEPAEAFVKALLEAEYYDVAADYLSRAQNSELVSTDFRKEIPYQRAKILRRSARAVRVPELQQQKLEQADQLLNAYASGLTDTRQKVNVLIESANIKLARSELHLRRSTNARLGADEKTAILSEADQLLRLAMQQYQLGETQLRTALENFQLDSEDPNSASEKQRLRKQFIKVRTQLPLVSEKLADSLPADSPERTELLKQAVAQSTSLYEKYGKAKIAKLFAFTAVTNGARASQKLGDHEKAIELLSLVFKINDGVAENRLKKNALAVAVNSWGKIEPYPHLEIIKLLDKRVALLNRTQQNDPDWQRIKLELADAKLTQADQLRGSGVTGAAGQAKVLSRDANKLVRKIARSVGPHSAYAKTIAEKWDLSFSQIEEVVVTDVKTFGDAKEMASELSSGLIELQNEVALKKRQVLSIADAAQKATAQSAVDEKMKNLQTRADGALAFYERSLALVDQSTSREDINFIRYQQTLGHFVKGQMLESALIAEFLLEKYPTVRWTRQASVYIVKGLSGELAGIRVDADKSYETNKLKVACREICQRWPNSNESAIAAGTAVKLALRGQNLAEAEEYFNLIPDSFSGKSGLAATLGVEFWKDYLRNGKLDSAMRSKRLNDCGRLLKMAVSNPPENITYPIANSSLTLINVFLEQKNFPQAVAQLEMGTLAPMKLIEQAHPAVTNNRYADQFRQRTYQAAVKTYLASMSVGEKESAIKKATAIIADMQTAAQSSNASQSLADLTAIYQHAGKILQDQFDNLESAERRKSFAPIVSQFVSTVVQGSEDPNTLLWAAQSLMKVASALSQEGAKTDAEPLFKQANLALDRAKSAGVNDPKKILTLQYLQALAYRGEGQYEQSVSEFIALLKTRQSNLTWQIDAAETLQMWGKNKSNDQAYAKALNGTGQAQVGKRKRNVVWGWRALEQRTRGNEKFNDAYRVALYNSVKTRFEYGALKRDKKIVASSQRELDKALKRFPFLNQGRWKAKFQALQAEIKKNK